MDPGNETPAFECRFLDESYFDHLLEKFLKAFSDYSLQFEFDSTKFRNHINLNAIDLNRTVGCFDRGEMVGFSLNGFGTWDGKRTVYDAGTGVIPAMRRLGASEAMFEMMVPIFRSEGYEQFLLEVITGNEPAVNLYKKLGFEIQRELLFLEAPGRLEPDPEMNRDVEIRPISAEQLAAMTEGWDGSPSWQNSNDAIKRSEALKTILGAFLNGEPAGYIVFSNGLGRVAQFFVHRPFRERGVGSRLLAEMEDNTREGARMQVINIDSSMKRSVEFFEKRGFRRVLSQYEMVMAL